jgi:uncharacterized protein
MSAATDTDDPILTTIVARLVSEFSPEEIYLFGSRARGDVRPDSDYDLMVVVSNSGEPAYRREQRAYGVIGPVGASKDVLIWTRAEFDARLGVPGSLPAAIQREGDRVYPR